MVLFPQLIDCGDSLCGGAAHPILDVALGRIAVVQLINGHHFLHGKNIR